MTFKKLAIITALLIASITSAAAGPGSYEQNDHFVNAGENGGGGQ
jgi:hypothetical protein